MSSAPGPSSSTAFASISLFWSDKIRLHQFPDSDAQALGQQIRSSWERGIQAEKKVHDTARPSCYCYEYKLRGNPFHSLPGEGIACRRLIRDVLALLYVRGWRLVTPLSHNQNARSKDSLLFRRQDSVALPPVDWLVIAPTGRDKLRVIYDPPTPKNKNKDGEEHDDEFWARIQALEKTLRGMEYFRSGERKQDVFEFKLKGSPWSPLSERRIMAERLVLAIFEVLDGCGWRSYATMRLRSGSGKDVMKQDTWFFVREEGWVAGSPFNAEL